MAIPAPATPIFPVSAAPTAAPAAPAGAAAAAAAAVDGVSSSNSSSGQAGKRATLVTIYVSHYCEKARWALQRYGVSFTEDANAPGFHRAAVKRAGSAGATVPCLRLPDSHGGGCLRESQDILRWVDAHRAAEDAATCTTRPPLFPPAAAPEAAEVDRLCRLFDDELGPAVRVWAYSHLLYTKPIAEGLVAPPVPAAQRAAFKVGLWYVVRAMMAKGMDINPVHGARALQVIERVFDEVGALLADGRPFLAGTEFTAADLAFAALAAPAVGQAYAGAPGIDNKALQQKAPGMVETVRRLRETPAGRFALRVFRTQRAAVFKV